MGKTMSDDEADEMLLNNSWAKFSDVRNLLQEAYEGWARRQSEVYQLTSQRDALLEALKSTGLFLHHCWCDIQMNDHSFERLNRQMEIVDAAIKAVEEKKNG